jgi:TatA/E family protein of Tat protein translocase
VNFQSRPRPARYTAGVFAGFGNPTHILFLVVVIVLVFGSGQVSKIARSAGRNAREAKDGIAKVKDEFEGVADVVDTVRSANPRTAVRRAVTDVVSPPKSPPESPPEKP